MNHLSIYIQVWALQLPCQAQVPGLKQTNLDVGKLSQVGVHGAQTFVGEALVVVQPQGVRVLKHTGNRMSINKSLFKFWIF